MIAARGHAHVVAQIIESQFVVGSVGNVRCVGLLPLRIGHTALDATDGESKPHIERSHPLHVPSCQVVVDGNDMDALAFQSVEVGRKCRNERLSFPGDHFSDIPAVKNHSPDELNVVMTHFEESSARFTACCKRFHEDVFQRLPVG